MEKHQVTRQNSAKEEWLKRKMGIKQQKTSTGLKLHYTEIATKKKQRTQEQPVKKELQNEPENRTQRGDGG